MSSEYHNDATEHARSSNSVKTAQLTGDLLRNQAPPIPTPPNGSSHRRRGHDLRDHDVTAQSFHSDDSDEPYSDDLTDSSLADERVDPFLGKTEIQNKVVQLEQQLADVRDRLNQAKIELAFAQSRRPTLYDDNYFSNELDGLRSRIRRWTVTYFSHAGGHWTKYAERRFGRLSDDWAAYMEDKDWRPWLIQARIWYMLQKLLFNPMSREQYSYLFAGRTKDYPVDQMLAQASQESSHANRVAYREWRASTFALLFPGKGLDINPVSYMQDVIDSRVKEVQRKIWRSLWTYAQHNIPREGMREAKASLTEIASAAICFDLDMKKHSVETSFYSYSCRVRSNFDPERMEEMMGRKGEGCISLVVSPPLYKETYSNNVPNRRLIKKSQVFSGIFERLPQNGYRRVISPWYTPESSLPKHEIGGRSRRRQQQFDRAYIDGRSSRGSRGSDAGRVMRKT